MVALPIHLPHGCGAPHHDDVGVLHELVIQGRQLLLQQPFCLLSLVFLMLQQFLLKDDDLLCRVFQHIHVLRGAQVMSRDVIQALFQLRHGLLHQNTHCRVILRSPANGQPVHPLTHQRYCIGGPIDVLGVEIRVLIQCAQVLVHAEDRGGRKYGKQKRQPADQYRPHNIDPLSAVFPFPVSHGAFPH